MPLTLKEPGFMKRAVPFSVATWHRMIAEGLAPKRAELIKGVIVEKMSKSILHSQVASFLARFLEALIGEKFWVRREDPITGADSEPEPDVSVVTGRAQDYRAHPTTARLVIEVSVTTLLEDREMADIYAAANVDEYWLVNATGRCVEVHRRPENGRYVDVTTVDYDGVIVCESIEGVTLRVADIFAGLPAENKQA